MKAFFDKVKTSFGPLSQPQVDGINILLDASNGLPNNHRAYVLGTAWHETAKTMQPITEFGKPAYFNKYDGRADLGNTIKGDGFRFRGRGFVQITGRRNYAKFAKLLGVDLVVNPELALQPDIAAKIIITGMRGGLFTGKKMADFTEFEAMRRVVNGTDKAAMIGVYAVAFERALEAVPVVSAPTVPQDTKPAPVPLPQAPRGLFKALLDLILAIFKRKA